MSTEIEQRLARLAHSWEAAAPAVTAGEARARVARPGEAGPDDEWSAVEPAPASSRGRTWLWGAAASIVVAVIVAAVLVGRPSNRSISSAQPEPTESTAEPASSVTDGSAAAPTAPATIPPTTPPPVEPAPSLAAVTEAVSSRLSALQSFRATATVHSSQRSLGEGSVAVAPESTSINEVTVLADGTLWIEGDTAIWSSYDASTGVTRAAFTAEDGNTRYQEIVGWTDNSTPLLIVFGHDPVMHFDSVDDSVEEVVSRLGRPAWRLTLAFGGGSTQSTLSFSQEETFIVDQESGLVVEYRRVSTNDAIEDVTEAYLDDLQLNVPLPDTFPGAFPDGAVVDRSGDPNGFALLTPEQAAERFGSGFLMPVVGDAEVRIVFSAGDGLWGEGSIPVTNLQVTIELRRGFAKSTVLIMKTVLQPDAVIADPGVIVVDGALCGSADGVRCSTDGQSVISAGALAGMPSVQESRSVSATDGPVQYTVLAADGAAALSIANSFA